MGEIGRYNNRQNDVISVKQYGDHQKVTYHSSILRKGYEDDWRANSKVVSVPRSKKGSVNDEKLENNISRARSKIQEYGYCNDWTYFVTLTIDANKFDRYDLNAFRDALHNFLHNLNRRRTADRKIVYLLVPEFHKDGAVHMHGLMSGLDEKDLIVNQHGYLDWKAYADRFGFISLDKVREKEKAVNYILKYVNKDLAVRSSELGAHLYYCSKGLKKAELLFRDNARWTSSWDYEHPKGYCKIKMLGASEDYSEYLCPV